MTATALTARPSSGADDTAAPLRRRPRRSGVTAGLSFLAPFLVVYALFVVWPVLQALRMSLFDWDLLGYTREYVGDSNYRRMLWGTDMTWDVGHLAVLRVLLLAAAGAVVLRGVRRGAPTAPLAGIALAGLALAAVLGFHPGPTGAGTTRPSGRPCATRSSSPPSRRPILVGLGLLMALALHSRTRGVGFYQAAFFLPYVLPISPVTLIWSYLLNPDRGLIGRVFGWVGLEPIAWLSDPDLALWGIVLTTVWWSAGFNLVLFRAGLQDIDPSLYEAPPWTGPELADLPARHVPA
jgi:multiple sugar transport system permease protein